MNILSTSVTALITLATIGFGLAEQIKPITVSVASTKPIGWVGQSATVSQIFREQQIPEGTVVSYWNEIIQNYEIATYEFGEWTNPHLQISTARGFYLTNPEQYADHTFGLHYNPVTTSTFSITMEAGKWYWLTYAFELDPSASTAYFLEKPATPYMSSYGHLYWPGNCCEDPVLAWYFDALLWEWHWYPIDRFPDCTRRWWSGDQLPPGFQNFWEQPFWFQNECNTRTWIQEQTPGF